MVSIRSRFRVRAWVSSVCVLLAIQAHAASYTATVDWIEVWPSGNVAFTLTGVSPACSTPQFIINKSNEGAKNLYALLLTAKATGNPVRVAQSACGPADGYGASYAIVEYLYTYW